MGGWSLRISNARRARRASAAQSTPNPLPSDEDAGRGIKDGEGTSTSIGGAIGTAVSPLNRRGRAFSERTLGNVMGGKNTSSTE
jgi:hypothetical protein